MSEPIPGGVLITGAAQRIGRALALDFADRGWRVAVHYHRSADAAASVVDQITAGGGIAHRVQADLADAQPTGTLVERAVDAIGPLTCLINNASVFELDTVQDATVAGWDRHLDANLRAPIFLSQGFAAQLPDDVGDANIINVIDQRVWKLTPFFTSYTISKSGLWTLTRAMAMALAPRIRVNGIGPGPVLPSARQSDESFAAQVAATPLRRGPSLPEICDTAQYLLRARSMTGQMIALDGGQHLPWPAADQVPHPSE